jgi:5,10-methylenetetrahydromethanopterin reductase
METAMLIGAGVGSFGGGGADVLSIVQQAVDSENDGLDAVWFNHILSTDSLIAVALVGQKTKRIELVTGVVPVYSREPLLMAQQALTVQVASQGRLSLGIGLAHPETAPLAWNHSYDRPAHFMEEYLAVLQPLLEKKAVEFSGDMITTQGVLGFPDVPAPKVLLAALGPIMLRMAGEQTDGTLLWVTGPKTIRGHVAPKITEAAKAAGRPSPRISAALPICITDDSASAREAASNLFSRYGRLVNYRRVLDIEGVDGPQDIAVVGNEEEAEQQIRELADAGATDFYGGFFKLSDDDTESVPRTKAFLKSIVGKI